MHHAILETQRFPDIDQKQASRPFERPVPFASSFRGDAKHRTRNGEIPGLVLRTIPE